jgi:D-alanyl-D-alanine-carboxypeptidase/D-alanyl-D-alanine-endopeptidase
MQHTTFFPSEEQCSHLLVSVHDEGTCTVTEATAGSSGLYSTATDMAIWLQYLLGAGGTGVPSLDPDAQAVYIVPTHLVRQKGLDRAGEPTGIGLGWIHILPVDSPSHIIEKTGGGAGFETYIAINHSRHTAIFLAATDGSVDTDLNLFNAANKLLLALAGLPPLPPPSPKPTRKRLHPHRHR